MTFRNFCTLILVAFVLMGVIACNPTDKATTEQIRQTRELTSEAQAQVGMPAITQFTERRLLRQLYELRDQEISTYTYVRDLEGNLWHLCDSIGFGMPFSAQFSNPESPTGVKVRENQMDASIYVLPMPEPNGLYPPTSSSATWVICADPNGDGFRPIYEESLITVSTFPLKAVGSYTKDQPPS